MSKIAADALLADIAGVIKREVGEG